MWKSGKLERPARVGRTVPGEPLARGARSPVRRESPARGASEKWNHSAVRQNTLMDTDPEVPPARYPLLATRSFLFPLACIGPAVTLPDREPRHSGFRCRSPSSVRLRLGCLRSASVAICDMPPSVFSQSIHIMPETMKIRELLLLLASVSISSLLNAGNASDCLALEQSLDTIPSIYILAKASKFRDISTPPHWKIIETIKVPSLPNWSATLYSHDSGATTLAFPGSPETEAWCEAAATTDGDESVPITVYAAIKTATRVKSRFPNILITGRSSGGTEAEIAAAMNNLKCVTFDSGGAPANAFDRILADMQESKNGLAGYNRTPANCDVLSFSRDKNKRKQGFTYLGKRILLRGTYGKAISSSLMAREIESCLDLCTTDEKASIISFITGKDMHAVISAINNNHAVGRDSQQADAIANTPAAIDIIESGSASRPSGRWNSISRRASIDFNPSGIWRCDTEDLEICRTTIGDAHMVTSHVSDFEDLREITIVLLPDSTCYFVSKGKKYEGTYVINDPAIGLVTFNIPRFRYNNSLAIVTDNSLFFQILATSQRNNTVEERVDYILFRRAKAP